MFKLDLFKQFPQLKHLDAEYVTEASAGSVELTGNSPSLTLK